MIFTAIDGNHEMITITAIDKYICMAFESQNTSRRKELYNGTNFCKAIWIWYMHDKKRWTDLILKTRK